MKKTLLWLGAALASFVVLNAMVFERLFFEVRYFSIGNGKRKRVKLVLLTDLHLRNNIWPYYTRLAKKINRLRPAVLLIAGDILDSSGQLNTVKEFFASLNRGMLKVAIAGNHDHINHTSISKLKQTLQQYNCKLLMNESVVYNFEGKQIAITGLDDFIKGNPDVTKAVENIGYQNNHLLLVHSPLQQENAMKQIRQINETRNDTERINISYIFAGHNHGGQVKLMGMAPVLPKMSGDYLQGWYNENEPYLYVSKGFGTTRLPIRFGSRAEITVFNYYMA